MKSLKHITRNTLLSYFFLPCLIGLILTICSYHHERDEYPYGRRTAWLNLMQSALLIYAGDNGGSFPDHPDGPHRALQLLYPKYLPRPEFLAGLSGDTNAVVNALLNKSPLTSSLSTWCYTVGARETSKPDRLILRDAVNGLNWSAKLGSYSSVIMSDGQLLAISTNEMKVFISNHE